MLKNKLSICEADVSYLNWLKLQVVELTSSAKATVWVGSVGVGSTVDAGTWNRVWVRYLPNKYDFGLFTTILL